MGFLRLIDLFAPYWWWWWGNNLESILLISPVAALYLLLGCRNADLQLLLRMQESYCSPWGDGILTHLPLRSPDPTKPQRNNP
jgi:hypothetical protein